MTDTIITSNPQNYSIPNKVKMFEWTNDKENKLLGEYDCWYDAEKTLWAWNKENPKEVAYI